ncbi:hypothetical protein PR202_gb14265 [Eleusine coracana subsp. coracana]|uniref:NB-ARC domain-containing protein n=1 Tax=Eleusine coracana subsp. coracana TaxID=191504 RepID=A0AAV5EVV1_ELECO|nr:hypothetical protein PR202_gb14265 [Eleusine coracana subsp. coracana]
MLEVAYLDDVVKNAAIIGEDDAAYDSVMTNTGKRSLALSSPFANAAKRVHLLSAMEKSPVFSDRGVGDPDERLHTGVHHAGAGVPRRNNVPRPVTMTLFMDRCVFGRHVEKERVVAFLLQRAHATTGLSALAIIGADEGGKTTLAKHVCDDKRVRDHFVRVEWFQRDDVLGRGGRPGQKAWGMDGPSTSRACAKSSRSHGWAWDGACSCWRAHLSHRSQIVTKEEQTYIAMNM